jgi:hypothetical protein
MSTVVKKIGGLYKRNQFVRKANNKIANINQQTDELTDLVKRVISHLKTSKVKTKGVDLQKFELAKQHVNSLVKELDLTQTVQSKFDLEIIAKVMDSFLETIKRLLEKRQYKKIVENFDREVKTRVDAIQAGLYQLESLIQEESEKMKAAGVKFNENAVRLILKKARGEVAENLKTVQAFIRDLEQIFEDEIIKQTKTRGIR